MPDCEFMDFEQFMLLSEGDEIRTAPLDHLYLSGANPEEQDDPRDDPPIMSLAEALINPEDSQWK